VEPEAAWRQLFLLGHADRPYAGGLYEREGWRLLMLISDQGGATVVRELRILPAGQLPEAEAVKLIEDWSRYEQTVPAGGLTARLLRTFPIGGLADDIRGALDIARKDHRDLQAKTVLRLGDVAWPLDIPLRELAGDEMLAVTAHLVGGLTRGGRASPAAETAEIFGISIHAVRMRLRRARDRGLVHPTAAGRRGADLTDKGHRIVDDLLDQHRRSRG
jgi:hypothetical protein